MSHTEVTSLEELEKILKENISKVVVLDVFADWCGPCRAIAPHLPKIGEKTETVIVKVNIDEVEEVGERYGVEALPTFIIFKNGEVVGRYIGANKEKLEEKIQEIKINY